MSLGKEVEGNDSAAEGEVSKKKVKEKTKKHTSSVVEGEHRASTKVT